MVATSGRHHPKLLPTRYLGILPLAGDSAGTVVASDHNLQMPAMKNEATGRECFLCWY